MRPWRLPRLAHTMGAGSFSAPHYAIVEVPAGPAPLGLSGDAPNVAHLPPDPSIGTGGSHGIRRKDGSVGGRRAQGILRAVRPGCSVVKVRAQPPPRPQALRAGRIGFGCERTLARTTRDPSSCPRWIRAQRRKRNRARRACVREHTAPARACGNNPSTARPRGSGGSIGYRIRGDCMHIAYMLHTQKKMYKYVALYARFA